MATFQQDPSPRARGKCLHCGQRELSHEFDAQDVAQCNVNDIHSHVANLKRRAKNNARNAAIRDAYASVGMRRVKGGLGGTYYE